MRFLFLLLAVSACAQMPHGTFPWWDSAIVRDLNLSEEQQRQIRSVVSEYRTKLIDARSAAEKAEGDLEDVFNDDKVDQRRGDETIERLASARADLTRTISQMSLRLRNVLTAQQWRELQKRRPPGRGPGPGGPLGPGPGGPPFRGRPQPHD